MLLVGLSAITVLVAAGFVLTQGRIAAAFAEPVAYARSFFYRDTLKPYGQVDAQPVISIHIDPQTGETRINQEQPSAGPAPLKLDVIGAAADDSRNLPPASRARIAATPTPVAPGPTATR